MRNYYIQTGTKLEGPYSVDELKTMKIDFHSKLCEQGTNEWKNIQEIQDYDLIKMDLKPDLLKEGRPWKKIAVYSIGFIGIVTIGFFVGPKLIGSIGKSFSSSELFADKTTDSLQLEANKKKKILKK